MSVVASCLRDRVIVIGGGIAGLATALRLAPLPVTLLVAAPLGTEASTPWAQGGIAAALGSDDDPALHAADTLAAGAGLGDSAIAAHVAAAAPQCIEALIAAGAPLDRDAAGGLALGLEAAHSRRRIVHAHGDGTGRAVIDTLIRAARSAPSIEILEGIRATELVVEDGAVVGVCATRQEASFDFPARAVVLASGGIGGLYSHTTNPRSAVGSGLALAAHAGAVLRDLEFVQFHPTAIAAGRDPMPLATEALRGEGAVLVNGRGERFMADTPGRELAPRDVVARAIWREIQAGETVFLDARGAIGRHFPERFPAVTALCRSAGLDPVGQPIPVRPAAHYHMGGVAVDKRGRTSVAGLWACGEVAATGLHGANRLASNSLLEALAFAQWIAADIQGNTVATSAHGSRAPQGRVPSHAGQAPVGEIRAIMSAAVGVVRDEPGLQAAAARLSEIAFSRARAAEVALAGLLVATAALERRESRGAHFRKDHPHASPAGARSMEWTLADVERLAPRPQRVVVGAA